jgi:hypothetical protein
MLAARRAKFAVGTSGDRCEGCVGFLFSPEDVMPKAMTRFTVAEKNDYHSRLLHLREIGVVTGPIPRTEVKHIFPRLVPIDADFARVFELPDEQVGVVLPAKLTVVHSGAMITEMRLKLPWSDCLLEVGDSRNHRFFPDVTQDWPGPLKILNDWLVDREVPLRTCQRSGLIVGTGWAPVPAAYPADFEVRVELSLYDQRDNVMRLEFKARLDRHIAQTSRVRRASLLRNAATASKSAGLFEPAKYPRTATEEILHPRG